VASREAEIRRVAGELDHLLDELGASVTALNAILIRPEPPGGSAENERLVLP
jgi:hypothetical protein